MLQTVPSERRNKKKKEREKRAFFFSPLVPVFLLLTAFLFSSSIFSAHSEVSLVLTSIPALV